MTTQTVYLRRAAWLSFFALILAAWWWMYSMATGMGLDLFGRAEPGGMQGMQEVTSPMPMTMTSAPVLVPMWIIMMAAMMGPTFVPTAQTYEDLIGSGAGTRMGFVGLIAGYLGLWFAAGALIGSAHVFFARSGLLDGMGASRSTGFTLALLLTAGAYQFTRAKERCLEHCRSPMIHFLGHWRPGAFGGAWMGARIGLWCVACCWAIMMIGFVGGAMNLAWMGAATLIMTLEKLPDLGRWLTPPLGVLFLGAAALVAAGLI